RRFCGPSGTCFMVRVALWAKTISPTATIHVTTMELVIGKPNGRAISTAFCDRPCSMLQSGTGIIRHRPECLAIRRQAGVSPETACDGGDGHGCSYVAAALHG